MLENEANKPRGPGQAADAEDTALIARTLDSAREVFDRLAKKHKQQLVGFVAKNRKNLKDPRKTVDEVVGDALAKAWEHFTTFRMESSFPTWLCGIAKNELRAKPKKQAESEVSIESLTEESDEQSRPIEETSVAASSPGPGEQRDARRRFLDYVRGAQKKLQPRLREVFYLYVAELSDEEIEYVLEMPHATLRTYKARLREQLEPKGQEA